MILKVVEVGDAVTAVVTGLVAMRIVVLVRAVVVAADLPHQTR